MNRKSSPILSEAKKDTKNAIKGLRETLLTEHNFRLELIIAAIVLLVSIALNITVAELCIVIVVIFVVLTAEVFNSAIERITNRCEFDAMVGITKDMAAGAVLMTVLASVIIGILIFGPHLSRVFRAL